MPRLLLTIAVVVLVGCAPVAMTSPRAVVTETSDFRVEAEPVAGKRTPSVEGYIYNKRGLVARSVRLRVDSLDAAGTVVATAVRPLDREVGIDDRVYFEVPAAAAAPAYRVTVDYVFWRSGASGP